MIQANQQTTTIDTWPYYEFEDYIKLLNKRNDEEKKAREESEKEQMSSSELSKISKMASGFNPSNFKMPNIPH